MTTAVFEKWSCVRGYHVYKNVWAAAFSKKFLCKRGRNKRYDIYAVAVVK